MRTILEIFTVEVEDQDRSLKEMTRHQKNFVLPNLIAVADENLLLRRTDSNAYSHSADKSSGSW